MKHYLFRDVPKKQRLSYFITYYKWHTLAAALVAAVVIAIISLILSPRDDLAIMWVSDDYDIVAEHIFREKIGQLPWDVNGDGHVKPASQYIDITDDPANMSEDERMAMVALLSSHTFNLFLLDETALNYFTELEVLGTRADYYGSDCENGDAIFSIPCSELSFFADEDLEAMRDCYLAIAVRPIEEEELALYRKQVDALKVITESTD